MQTPLGNAMDDHHSLSPSSAFGMEEPSDFPDKHPHRAKRPGVRRPSAAFRQPASEYQQNALIS